MAITNALDDVLKPLDAARRELLLGAWRVPWIGRLLRHREMRIPAIASISVVVAFGLTCFAPGLLFVLGPALLGVPHVASDIRYLVLRRDLPPRWIALVTAGCATLLALRIIEVLAPHGLRFAALEAGLGWGLALAGATMGALGARDGGGLRRCALAATILGGALLVALRWPLQARMALAYGHNIVALVLWFFLFRHRKAYALAPLALVAAGTAVLFTGVTLSWLRADGPFTLTFMDEALASTRFLPESVGLALGLTYVFQQAVHYSAWLTWIPQEETRSGATLTFRMSMRAARRDFGGWGLAAVCVLAATVVLLSFVAVHRTRALYLSLATFHAYLEIASLAFFMTRAGKRTGVVDRSPSLPHP
jgi:hypothetical protein